MHGERNYPLAKMRSTVDVALADGTDDDAYIAALDRHLPDILDGHIALGTVRPDLAFYLAGVDIAAGDRYGELAVSEVGIRRRDGRVVNEITSRGIPLVIVLGGGYASSPARTAELHAHAFRAAVARELERPRNPAVRPRPSTPSTC